MSDPYAALAAQDDALQERIADAMEARCLEPSQKRGSCSLRRPPR